MGSIGLSLIATFVGGVWSYIYGGILFGWALLALLGSGGGGGNFSDRNDNGGA